MHRQHRIGGRQAGPGEVSHLRSFQEYVLRPYLAAFLALVHIACTDQTAAVLGITEGMADFLGPFGIRVNSVAPAVVASALMGPDRLVSAACSLALPRAPSSLYSSSRS